MKPLRILITNHNLGQYGGTELYTRDLAIGLLSRGHTPIVFSTNLGTVADQLTKATVCVVDDLSKVSIHPDVIHSQHSLESALALLSFPGVPVVHACHDFTWEHDVPPRVPRIRRYIAVDYTVRDRLMLREGVSPDKIQVLQNAVNLKKFLPRTRLPEQLKFALVFSNYMTPAQVEAIRQACQPLGISVDSAGANVWNPIKEPETLLPQYDLIFAKGRCAWEALAVGSAVIVCDTNGMGPLVTSAELDFLKARNFGRRLLQNPVTAENVRSELARFSSADMELVTQNIRQTAGLDQLLDQLLKLYAEVIGEQARSVPTHYDEEMQSTARMLAWWWKSQPVFNPYLFAANAAVEANRSQYAALKQEMDSIQDKLAKLAPAA